MSIQEPRYFALVIGEEYLRMWVSTRQDFIKAILDGESEGCDYLVDPNTSCFASGGKFGFGIWSSKEGNYTKIPIFEDFAGLVRPNISSIITSVLEGKKESYIVAIQTLSPDTNMNMKIFNGMYCDVIINTILSKVYEVKTDMISSTVLELVSLAELPNAIIHKEMVNAIVNKLSNRKYKEIARVANIIRKDTIQKDYDLNLL